MLKEDDRGHSARILTVVEERAGQRLDNLLLAELKAVPRSLVYRLVRTGQVRVNKGRVQVSYRVQAGDQVRIPPLRLGGDESSPVVPSQGQTAALEEAILYEDGQLIVLNKPAGLAVHGGSGLSFGVIEALRALRPQETSLELVHRLDRDTSGCLLVAKRRSMLRWLHGQLREQGLDKRYWALLAGVWRRDSQEVDQPLLKNTLQGGERVVRVDPAGKPSRTRFRRVRQFRDATLVEARLDTGRTHQIRVHAAVLGTPVLGDDKYGDRDANRRARDWNLKRLFLHAVRLVVPLPDGNQLRIEAPLSDELQRVLDRLDATGDIARPG